MSVHLELKKQMTKFIAAERNYRELDMKREQKIEAVISEAKAGKAISLVDINAVTGEINQLSKLFGFPLRKSVTKEMVFEFIKS